MKRSILAAILILAVVLSVSIISASSLQNHEKPTRAIRAGSQSEETFSEIDDHEMDLSNTEIQETGAPFVVNPGRFDPYKNFKYRVKWDGRYVAGVSYVSPLIRTTEVIEHREGGDPSSLRRSPGLTLYEPIILERGVTHDIAFEQWVNKVWNFGSGLGSEVSLADFRKDIIIEVYNEAGQLALAYKVYRCWPSEYQALSELDANKSGVAFQRIKLENEGWERDYEVDEPIEPSFVEPPG
ncbi:MAG: phage tail protein [Methanotrichaceae archaeon]|nr:phage tail protein [Methanotrichaceae archaeon]